MHQGHIGMRAYSAQVPSSSLRIIFQSLGLFPTHGAAESPDCLPKTPSPFFACVRVDNIKKLLLLLPEGFFTRCVLWAGCLHFSIGRKLWICAICWRGYSCVCNVQIDLPSCSFIFLNDSFIYFTILYSMLGEIFLNIVTRKYGGKRIISQEDIGTSWSINCILDFIYSITICALYAEWFNLNFVMYFIFNTFPLIHQL
jgi:hypothetical protein